MSHSNTLLSWVGVAPIHSLFVVDHLVNEDIKESRSPLIRFSEDLEIGQLTVEEQQHLYRIEIIRRVGGSLHSDRYFAAKARYKAPFDGELLQVKQNEINDLLESILQTMRVFRDGPVYFGGLAHWVEQPFTGVTNLMSRSWPELPFALYPLDDAHCLSELEKFWQAVQSNRVKLQRHITVSMRWFSRACEVNRPDDRLINLMIAAEALSRPPKGEKATLISSHIQSVISDASINGQRVLDAMVAAYKLRNDLVHEGAATAKWNLKYGHVSSDLNSLVHEVEGYIREALRNTIAKLAGLNLTVSAGKILIG